MKKDITTKEVLKQIAEDIALHLLHFQVTELDFVDKELQVVEKRESDLVGHCYIDGIESILHLEIQNSNDKTMHFRMLRYYALIKSRFPKLPVHQFVIYIGHAKLTMRNRLESDDLTFKYQLIDMHQIDCESLIAINKPSALVLAVLCDFKGKPETEVLTRILSGLEQLTGDDEYAFGKYTLALETLSDNRKLQKQLKEAEEMLRTVKMEQLPSYEIGYEKGTMTGIQIGEQRGMQIGEQRGMQIGEQRGMQIGEQRGMQIGEQKAKLEAAKVMLEMGISAEEIAKRFGIPLALLGQS